MAFLVAGTLQAAAQVADARQSLERKGTYSLQGPRVALTLSSPEVSASTVLALEDALRVLGFQHRQRREASVQGFLGELAGFRKRLEARGGPVGCVLVALVAPRGQLSRPRRLVQELGCCGALRTCPKVFLLLASAPGAAPEPGAFLTHLGELRGRRPHWCLLQLLTEVFCKVTEESSGATYCPVLRSSLRGTLYLQDVEPWGPEPALHPSTRYSLSGAREALLMAVSRDRPGAQHDVEALEGLCEALGFETTLRMNPKAQTFQEELAQFRERLDTRRGPVSCALVALMAHGGPQGQLLGADGHEVQPEVLVQELSCCRALRDGPKVFLLQACRGGHRDAGVRPTVSWIWRWLRTPPATHSHADILQIYADGQGSSSRDLLPGSCSQRDILVAYAAAEGCVAYRDERGSDFVQLLVEVLSAHPEGDLLELLTEVNRRLCELDVLGPGCDQPRKACLEVRSSLRARLCLQA